MCTWREYEREAALTEAARAHRNPCSSDLVMVIASMTGKEPEEVVDALPKSAWEAHRKVKGMKVRPYNRMTLLHTQRAKRKAVAA